jgi:hypothetical protein
MSRTTWLVSVSLVLVGCGGSSSSDPFKASLPSQSSTALTVPGGGSATASVGESQQALLGATAQFYLITRTVTRDVNGLVGAILALVEHITDDPASARDANRAVWGPLTDALSPATYLLVVEKVGPSDYHYVLTGKPKGADDTAYQAVLAGAAHVVDEAHGSGDFLADFSAAHALDPTAQATGGIAVHYDNTSNPRVVEVGFKDFVGKTGEAPNNALYRFAEHPDHSGNFEFAALTDIDHDGQDLELLAILSRWSGDGRGRSDVSATGGSLGTITVVVEECWDAAFAESYYTDNLGIAPTSGDPASCAF